MIRPRPELQTARLLLRRWRGEDLAPMAAINADPAVMEHFPASMSRPEVALLIARLEAGFERDGCGFWANAAPVSSETASNRRAVLTTCFMDSAPSAFVS